VAEQDERRPSETVPFKTVQIVAGALIAGPLIFSGITYAIPQGQPPGDQFLAYFAIGFSLIALVVSPIASSVAGTQSLRRLESQGAGLSNLDFFGVLQTRVIVRSAVLEGAAFFCCIAYLSTRQWWTLGMVFMLLAVMAILFPTRGRFDNWVREQRENRSLGGESLGS
jgi:hypothetical protein